MKKIVLMLCSAWCLSISAGYTDVTKFNAFRKQEVENAKYMHLLFAMNLIQADTIDGLNDLLDFLQSEPSFREVATMPNKEGWTLLGVATYEANIPAIRILLSHGVPVPARGSTVSYGSDPIAIAHKHFKINDIPELHRPQVHEDQELRKILQKYQHARGLYKEILGIFGQQIPIRSQQ